MATAATDKAKSNGGYRTLVRFLPMLWPKGEGELKARVIVAVLLVLAGKAAVLLMPFAYKAVIDRMSRRHGRVRRRCRVGRGLCHRSLRRSAGRQFAQRLVRESRASARRAGLPATSFAMSTIYRCASISSAAPEA